MSTQSLLKKAIFATVSATFFVPLIMAPAHFIFPFIVPKAVVFRSLTLIILGLWLVLLVMDWQRYRIRSSITTITVLVFFATLLLSTFLGVDWYRSFWDNHERMLGLFTIAHYLIYYLVLTAVVQRREEWRQLLRMFLFAGSIVMVIAFIQRFSPTFLLNQSGSRTAATLGNPIYVGGYGLFLTFVGWYLAVTTTHKGWRLFAALGGVLGFLGIFWSGTRGALLGLVAGVGVLSLLYLIRLKDHPQVRRALFAFFGLSIVAFGLLFAFRTTPFVRKIPAVGSLLNLSLSSGTAGTRLMAWGVAVEAWQERPVFGWGPNNYYYAFNKYYRPEFLEHGWGETWFDNAHNIVVNTLATQGLVGVTAYLGLFAVVVWQLWRAMVRGHIDVHVGSVGIAFLLAHLVQNVFVFENLTSYLYFFFWLAFMNHVLSPNAVDVPEKNTALPTGFAVTMGLIIFILIYATNWNPARANMQTLVLLRSLYNFGDPLAVYAEKGKIPTPHREDIRNDFARTVLGVTQAYAQAGRKDEGRELLRFAYRELQKNRALHPDDIRTHLMQTQLAEQAAVFFGDTTLLIDAELTLKDALSKSPKRQQVQFMLASVQLALGKLADAEKLFVAAVQNDPKVGESWWRLAYFYHESRQPAKAIEIVRKARESGAKFDENGLRLMEQLLPSTSTAATATGTAPVSP